MAICKSSSPETMDFWPAGLQSPSVYFMMRRRQLAYTIRSAALDGPSLWRQRSVAGDAPSQLRCQRNQPPLTLQLPLIPDYELMDEEGMVYVRSIDQPLAGSTAQTQPQPLPGRTEQHSTSLVATPQYAAAVQRTSKQRFAPPAQQREQARARRSSKSLTPATTASSSSSSSSLSSFTSSAASSPLVAFFNRVKELLSPMPPQQLG